ncbi:MAG TPA: hypothetical protein VF618_03275 [Thermoanaerobaculia bacterium]
MIDDPVVEETHRVRREMADEFGGDVHRFFEYLRQRERSSPDGVVTLEPNAPEAMTVGIVPKPRA